MNLMPLYRLARRERPRRTGAVRASMFIVLALAAGCTEDVGECFSSETDMREGLDTVVVGGQVQYGGQAIMNRACATGCHSSTAKGAQRSGAPAGLDFDLLPVQATATTESAVNPESGRTYAVIDADRLNGLRERQRKVFSERNRIWQQVKDGLMPPDGMFASFRSAVTSIFDSVEDTPCTRGAAYSDIESKSTQDVLRNWLACQAPIVESYGGPVDGNRVAGKAGYQYLACEGGDEPVGDGGAGDGGGNTVVVTLEDLYDGILQDATCIGCHPALAKDYPLDLSSLDKAYATLVTDKAVKCNGKPYVTPNDPDKSFLMDVISKDDPGCDIERMPQGFDPLTTAQIKQIRDWISGGALRSAAFISPPLNGGLDAGVK